MSFKKSKFIPTDPGLIPAPPEVEYDPRKALLSRMPVAVKPKPAEFFGFHAVRHISKFEYYQGGKPSCVAESGSRYAGVLSLIENKIFIKPSVQVLMAYIKEKIEKNQGSGAIIESCPQALREYGSPAEKLFKSDYDLSWKEFIDVDRVPLDVQEAGKKQKIETYAWTDGRDLESIKVGVFFGEGNMVQDGAIGSGLGWPMSGYVRIPKEGEKMWGHAIDFFGYDNKFNYFINSWSRRWGLTLYLKLKKDNFGKYFVKGTRRDYNIIIKGVGAMSKDYEQVMNDGHPYLFRGLTYIDLPDDIAAQIKMVRTIKVKNDTRTYAVMKDQAGNAYYIWITSDRAYNAGVKNGFWLDWDKIQKVNSIDNDKIIGTFTKAY